MTKLQTIEQLAKQVQDGSLLALGGNALHRSPLAFVFELVKQQKKELAVIKTAGALDVDVLAAKGALRTVHAGYIGFEMFGLAPSYRKSVQAGELEVKEHACASVIAALRASIYGVPFLPLQGFQGSELPKLTDVIRWTTCPFTQQSIAAVAALTPDYTIVHVDVVDTEGNAYIEGAIFEDELMIKAGKKVFITAEKVIQPTEWTQTPQIPGFLVASVALAKNGAAPGSCGNAYSIDENQVRAYLQEGLSALLEEEVDHD